MGSFYNQRSIEQIQRQKAERERRARRKRWLKLSAAGLMAILLGAGLIVYLNSRPSATPKPAKIAPTKTTQNTPPQKNYVRITAAGDMLPHAAINLRARTDNSYDYKPFFAGVKNFTTAGDVRFCNQESPSDASLPVAAYPTFNAPIEFPRDLEASGCNVIGLANNHLNDKGQAGIDGTRAEWDKLKPLGLSGANRSAAEQKQISYFTIKGVKFAFLAYAEYSNNKNLTPYGLNLLDKNLVTEQVKQAQQQADIVLVSVHWGTESMEAPNAIQKTWAKTLADLGVDAVIGTGPHWLQPVEKLPKNGGGETIVWYSLGNFLSAQLDIEGLVGGLAVMDVDPASKSIVGVGFLPTYMHYEWTPAEKARDDLLARHSFGLFPLDQAVDPLARSLNNTTVPIQTERVSRIMNSLTKVPILTSQDFTKRLAD
jgi:poly-gamma-glutamate synthesis protein (capsule biosynthesis protein)